MERNQKSMNEKKNQDIPLLPRWHLPMFASGIPVVAAEVPAMAVGQVLMKHA